MYGSDVRAALSGTASQFVFHAGSFSAPIFLVLQFTPSVFAGFRGYLQNPG